MIHLNAVQTKVALPFGELIDALELGFKSEIQAPMRHHHILKNNTEADSVLKLMPAWFDDKWGGVKMVNIVPDNSKRGLASVSSSYILFDRKTGAHELLLDGGELTARRTAAASALAAKFLARPNSKIQLVVGAGRVGSYIPHAYREILPIEEVLIYNRTVEKSEQLVEVLNEQGFNASVVTNLKEAVQRVDVVTCATLTAEPLVFGNWIKAGQHIDLIGSFTPQMREVDDLTLQKSSLYVDTLHAIVESGDFSIPIASGAIKKSDIKATLSDLCKMEHAARTSMDEITLFKSAGTAIEDLAAAILALKSLAV